MYNSLPRAVTFFLSKGMKLSQIFILQIFWRLQRSFSVWVNNCLDKTKFNIFIRFAVAPDAVAFCFRSDSREQIRTTTIFP